MALTSGLRRYYGAESGNVLLGQLGFDVISTAGTSTAVAGVTAGYEKVKCWVTLLSLHDATEITTVTGAGLGDNLSTQLIKNGIAVSGMFTTVTCTEPNGIFLAYRG